MFDFQKKHFILILWLLLKFIIAVKAASLQLNNFHNEDFKGKLSNLEHFGSDSGYGPPIQISSGILHLEDTKHIKEPTIVYQGVLSHHLPIWNEISTEWQPNHPILLTNDEENHHDMLQPNFGNEGHGIILQAPEPAYNGGGLHTHIIGSSTIHGQLDDKIDLSNNIDTKEKYYIKSYG